VDSLSQKSLERQMCTMAKSQSTLRDRVALSLLGFFLVMVFWSMSAQAHTMRTGYLTLKELRGERLLLTWRATIPEETIRFKLPSFCRKEGSKVQKAPNAWIAFYRCSQSLHGQKLIIHGLGDMITEVVVEFQREGGQSWSTLLTAQRSHLHFPKTKSSAQVMWTYLTLGFWHIWEGLDHLLFMLGLLLLVQKPKAILVTATFFTLAHSLTLAGTVLELFRVSGRAAEACIALSLIFCARDVLRRDKLDSPERLGAWMGLGFGLVHGFGFAGSLLDIGFPPDAIPMSLLGFNLGVEVAQVAFLLTGLLLLAVCKRFGFLRQSLWVGAYLIGVSGVYMLLERCWSYIF